MREGHFNEGTKEEILAYLFTDIVVLCKPTKMKVLSRHSAKFKVCSCILWRGPEVKLIYV